MYKEYTQKRQKFVVFIAVSSEYRCIQTQNNRLKIIYPCMKVGSLHMGLTDKTVLLSQRCPVKINCNKERVVEWIRRNQWEIIIFINNLITG